MRHFDVFVRTLARQRIRRLVDILYEYVACVRYRCKACITRRSTYRDTSTMDIDVTLFIRKAFAWKRRFCNERYLDRIIGTTYVNESRERKLTCHERHDYIGKTRVYAKAFYDERSDTLVFGNRR